MDDELRAKLLEHVNAMHALLSQPAWHTPTGTNQQVFNALGGALIVKMARSIAYQMATARQDPYRSGPVEGWGLAMDDYQEAIRRLRAAGLL